MRNLTSTSVRLPRRRDILAAAAGGAAAVLVAPALAEAANGAVPAKAASYPAQAFAQSNKAAALKAMFGGTPEDSPNVKIEAPDIAENGAVVPVIVDANLPNVTAVSILALDNPFTLAASYKVPRGTSVPISSRIKLAKTMNVMAVVESDGKLYSASKEVKVTLGGCG